MLLHAADGAGSLFEDGPLPAEVEEGPTEYKRKLLNPSATRFNKLVRQHVLLLSFVSVHPLGASVPLTDDAFYS